MCRSCDGFFSLLLKEMVWSLGVFQSERVLLPAPAHRKFVTKKDAGKTHGVKGFLKISVQNYLRDKWHTVNGDGAESARLCWSQPLGAGHSCRPAFPLRAQLASAPSPGAQRPEGTRRRLCALPSAGR